MHQGGKEGAAGTHPAQDTPAPRPLQEKWQPAPVFSPAKPHGQRSLAGLPSWGCKESDMTLLLDNPDKCGLQWGGGRLMRLSYVC